MLVADFDFELPPERIALRPVNPRDAARMLEVRGATLGDFTMRDLPTRLRAGDVLVVNDTRVIPAQLHGTTAAGARIGVTLHKREAADMWWSFVRNARRLKPAARVDFGAGLSGEVLEKADDGAVLWRFFADGPIETDVASVMAAAGAMPLPPYIASKRATDARDAQDYQTLHATKDGAVAAPTAGLHFTPELWAGLAGQGARHRRSQDARRMGQHRRRYRSKAQRRARRRRPGHRGRHDIAAPARIGGKRRCHPGFHRRYRHLHHARLPLRRHRWPDHQFPSAQIDAVHAGIGTDGARCNAGGV
jgi:hypothetical protein